MIDFLTFAILIAALFQPSRDRFNVAMLFAVFTEGHGLFMSNLDGMEYYVSAALFDLLVIAGLFLYPMKTRLIEELQRISIVSIMLNFFGWIAWMLYFPPTAYNVSFMMLYTWTIITLLRKERGHVGDHSLDSRHPRFPVHHGPGNPSVR